MKWSHSGVLRPCRARVSRHPVFGSLLRRRRGQREAPLDLVRTGAFPEGRFPRHRSFHRGAQASPRSWLCSEPLLRLLASPLTPKSRRRPAQQVASIGGGPDVANQRRLQEKLLGQRAPKLSRRPGHDFESPVCELALQGAFALQMLRMLRLQALDQGIPVRPLGLAKSLAR
eukprot:scaffold575_cov242-Pinguiococcus_pyrenoidosus.AAC.6